MAGPSELPPDPHEKNAQPDAKKDVKGEDWVERLAQRSAGLSGPKPSKASDEQESPAALWRVAGMGLEFAATTVVFALIGIYVDHRTGWSPWSTVTFTAIGCTGSLYLLIKTAMRMNK